MTPTQHWNDLSPEKRRVLLRQFAITPAETERLIVADWRTTEDR